METALAAGDAHELRRAAHTLTDGEEKILADAAPLANSASNIYGVLANADERSVDWAAAEGWNSGLADDACFAAVDPEGFFSAEIDGAPAATDGELHAVAGRAAQRHAQAAAAAAGG